MITKYLEDHIKIVNSVESWQKSIEEASEKLLEKGYITEKYVSAMIDGVVRNGSYIVILPKVAIPHSRPNGQVNKTTISLMKLNESVCYPEDKMVDLIIVLAAVDNEAHMELISGLSELLGDSNKLQMLRQATTIEDLITVLDMESI